VCVYIYIYIYIYFLMNKCVDFRQFLYTSIFFRYTFNPLIMMMMMMIIIKFFTLKS
jgi:hypothetical protein